MIAADAITAAKIADDAIDSEHITDGSVDHVHLAGDAVDGDNLADNAVDSEHITDGSIDTAHYADNSITGAELADNIDIAGTLDVTGVTTLDAALTVAGSAVAGTITDTSNTGNVTLDFSADNNFVLTLTGNTVLVNPTTEIVGQSGFIVLIQDGTGSRTLAHGNQFFTPANAGITLSAGAADVDILPYVVQAAGKILLGTPQLDFS